jgi:hypothetical protein
MTYDETPSALSNGSPFAEAFQAFCLDASHVDVIDEPSRDEFAQIARMQSQVCSQLNLAPEDGAVIPLLDEFAASLARVDEYHRTTRRAEEIRETEGVSWEAACKRAEDERDAADPTSYAVCHDCGTISEGPDPVIVRETSENGCFGCGSERVTITAYEQHAHRMSRRAQNTR